MRVITGSAKGRKIIAPPGLSTRPTTDWIKESVFNIIQFDIEGRRVLDIFAGSGQMGIEALSRGAHECVFVENDRTAVKVISENLKALEFTEVSTVYERDYKAFLKSEKGKFDLVFLDPPYGDGHIVKTLELFSQFDILSDGGIIICEGTKEEKLPPAVGNLKVSNEYLYGRTKITLYVRTGES
jgi:16S rRNA (guanine(966)-N(2))-methyltransferase RsmD